MYRILIAEDDNTIRKGLAKIIGNMALPVGEILEAEDGRAAMEAVRQQSPDIVITDIRMPHMSGLDFIEQARAINPGIRFVILSGYSEFSYAQRAISFNVSEYLLKPVKKEKLHQTLLKLMDQLAAENAEREQKQKNDKKLKDYYSVLLKDILEGYQNASDLDDILANAGIPFRPDGFAIFSFYCRAGSGFGRELPAELADELKICFQYVSRYHHIICLANMGSDEYAAVCPRLKGRLAAAAAAFKAQLYCGVSTWADTASRLTELVREAEKALDYRLLNLADRVYHFSEVRQHTRLKPVLNAYYDELHNAMSSKDLKSLSTAIDRLFDFLQKLSPATPGLFRNPIACYFLYHMPSDRQDQITAWINGIEDLYQASDSLFDFKANVKQLFQSICKAEAVDNAGIYNNKIVAAIKYIENNYAKNLSLEDVAGQVNINASYFSNTFKKETGMYFSDFLQKIRIERSKSLLLEPRYKIYEIAESVGFLDEKYFFKVFKKLTGVTPNQYRNGIRPPGPPEDGK